VKAGHKVRDRWISLAVLAAIAAIWQALSILYPLEAAPGEPMIAGWQVMFTKTLLSMADYWQGGLGVPSVSEGAPRTYLAAVLSLLSHSFDTIVRLVCGLALGGVVDLPVQFLRTLPLLAMVPLFQLWFGTYFIGKVLFVAYGIGVIVFAGTVNAVRNVPQIYIDNARSLGASKAMMYRTVILPAILPEMRSTLLLSLGTGWGAVLGAEYLGAQSGLGYIIVYAGQFAYLDRMSLVAIIFIVATSISYRAVGALTSRMLEWAPESQRA
jgi:sulfonate transport system permease protein